MQKKSKNFLTVRALRTKQGGHEIYSFFMNGGDITRVADISRIERTEDDAVRGFQRREIRDHVRSIVQYLDQGGVLFPNAITLAFSPEVRFVQSRGPKPTQMLDMAQSGSLVIPLRDAGDRAGWIVDGQQRSLALSEAKNPFFPVPVVAFICDNLQEQREQFILMNKAKPLPTRLINELLPETGGVLLPRELSSRKIPSQLCSHLNKNPTSPFYDLIKRISDGGKGTAVIVDTAVIKMIKNSIGSPLGALSTFKATGTEQPDITAMYRVLSTYWSAVKEVFPDAWGLPPTKSRLMHGAGIEAMGFLMDRMYARHSGKPDEAAAVKADLTKIAPFCAWTEGEWDHLGMSWNDIQNTPKHIRGLSDALVRIYSVKAPR